MNILVCMKQTEHTANKPDRSGIEAALRLKAQKEAHVKVIYIGKTSAMTLIREAIAMGCDSGALIECVPAETLDALTLAKLLMAAVSDEVYDIIYTGCYAADADAVQMGLLLAGLLHLPHASYVSHVWLEDRHPDSLYLKRQMEDRFQILRLSLPCLVSALPLPGKPIYSTVDGITKAYSSDINVISASKLLKRLHVEQYDALFKIKCCRHFVKDATKRGEILTVPADEAVEAIIEKIKSHHLL